MKKWLIASAAVVLAFAATPYGLTAISYALIPPEHGYFRYYEAYDNHRSEVCWTYLKVSGNTLDSVQPREKRSNEEWELVNDSGRRYFLYDARNEFDGMASFDRTEMILQHADGKEEHYRRVLNLWEILAEYRKSNGQKKSHDLLAPRREEHEQQIAARMKERNIKINPAGIAQRRPPVITPLVSFDPSPMPTPIFAVTEFGYRNNTGTVFALYADGTMIYSSLPEDPAAPYHRDHVPDAAQFLKELVGQRYQQMPKEIRLFEATDQTTTRLWTPNKTVEIYGPWREPPRVPDWAEYEKQINEDLKSEWESKGAGIRPVLLKIDELRKHRGEAWFPPKIEVRFWDYERAWKESVEWPSDWPGLYDVTTKKNGRFYRVYVPSNNFARLTAFLESRDPSGAVMIDLNKMIPTMRFPIPREDAWLEQ